MSMQQIATGGQVELLRTTNSIYLYARHAGEHIGLLMCLFGTHQGQAWPVHVSDWNKGVPTDLYDEVTGAALNPTLDLALADGGRLHNTKVLERAAMRV